MSFVPKNKVNGQFMFDTMDRAGVLWLKECAEKRKITPAEMYSVITGVLNNDAMSKLLNQFEVELDFKVGDALLFDKTIIHRSKKLLFGVLKSRLALVLRFIDVNSIYDKDRVELLEFPNLYFNFENNSSFHVDIYDQNSEKIANSSYFDAPELRMFN